MAASKALDSVSFVFRPRRSFLSSLIEVSAEDLFTPRIELLYALLIRPDDWQFFNIAIANVVTLDPFTGIIWIGFACAIIDLEFRSNRKGNQNLWTKLQANSKLCREILEKT